MGMARGSVILSRTLLQSDIGAVIADLLRAAVAAGALALVISRYLLYSPRLSLCSCVGTGTGSSTRAAELAPDCLAVLDDLLPLVPRCT